MMVSPLSILDKAASRCVQFSSAYCFLQRFERHQSLLIACAAYNNNNNISLDFFFVSFCIGYRILFISWVSCDVCVSF